MGQVYLAMSGHQGLETLCVVKRLLPSLTTQPEYVRRFRHEVDLARRLTHGNLAHTHHVGEEGGEVFLVQQFVEGHDLSHLLEQMSAHGREVSVDLAVYIASEIAKGLSYAHSFENLHLIHRDINPPNVRLTYAGEVKLLDFGVALSTLEGHEIDHQSAAGKLWYLAPEQIIPGQTVDQRSDLYAVGVLLWEMLTQLPFGTLRDGDKTVRAAETDAEVMTFIARGNHECPSKWNPKVGRSLDDVVMRLLRVDPLDRYLHADELRDFLLPFLPTDGHADRLLATEMGLAFAPEAERAERTRLIQEGRYLLLPPGSSDLMASVAAPTANKSPPVSSTEPPVREGRRRLNKRHGSRMVWILSIGSGVLLGLATLVAILYQRAVEREQFVHYTTAAPEFAPAAVPPLPSPVAVTDAGETLDLGLAPRPAPHVVDLPPKDASTPRPVARTGRPVSGSSTEVSKEELLVLAREAFNQRDYDHALAFGQKALTVGGGAEAHALLGNTYFKLGRMEKAEEAFSEAVHLDPGNELFARRLRLVRGRAEGNGP